MRVEGELLAARERTERKAAKPQPGSAGLRPAAAPNWWPTPQLSQPTPFAELRRLTEARSDCSAAGDWRSGSWNLPRLTGAGGGIIFPAMTTTLTKAGHIVVPKAVRQRQKLRAGDKFEFIADADEPGVFELRRVRRKPNEGLVKWLYACPVRGIPIPKRSKELPREFAL